VSLSNESSLRKGSQTIDRKPANPVLSFGVSGAFGVVGLGVVGFGVGGLGVDGFDFDSFGVGGLAIVNFGVDGLELFVSLGVDDLGVVGLDPLDFELAFGA